MADDPTTVVRAAFAAVGARDADALAALVDPGCEFHTTGTSEAVGRLGPYVGAAGAREYLADLERAWARFSLLPDELRVVRRGVVAFGHVDGTLRDGTEVHQGVIWVFKLAGGRLRSARVTETAAQAERLAADDATA